MIRFQNAKGIEQISQVSERIANIRGLPNQID